MSQQIFITVPMGQFSKVRDAMPKVLDDIMRKIGMRLQREGKALVEGELGRYATGNLASTYRAWVSLAGVTMTIGPAMDALGHNYVPDVFEGVTPHTIDQLMLGRKYPMRWQHVGGSGVAWKVKHPGQRARTDIVEALKALALQVAGEEMLALELLGVLS